ncbi:MAG: dTDP-4-dehydrorhamnose 3,5-epimerase family protein [Nocardioidaceae bacterium]
MDVRELSVTGAFELTPRLHGDDRGGVLEWFRADEFADAVGHRFDLVQANLSLNRAGALRGIHFARLPPSQAKYVTCVHGAAFDVVVDIRVGSPTYGRWDAVLLDDTDHRVIYVGEGLGHAFLALADDTAVSYLCSAPYTPQREHDIDPFDPALAIDWPATTRDGSPLEVLRSEKDASAPTLEEVRRRGLLPTHDEVRAFLTGLG